MNPVKGEPLKEIERFFDEDFMPLRPATRIGWDLAVDLYEEKGMLLVEMNVPGIDPEKLEITIHEGYLRIAGSREEEKKTRSTNYFCKEIKRGTFERTVRLPARVQLEHAEASYKNGTLKILMPRLEQEETGRIPVRVK